jgi:hypothetical protein
MPTTVIQGSLEIDHERGVIYFHTDPLQDAENVTLLRICSLPVPIPQGQQLDLTWGHACTWGKW